MTLGQALYHSTQAFKSEGIDDAHIEARILLGHVLKLSPARLYAQTEQPLTPEQTEAFRALVGRRLSREPSAYIVRRKEFYGIDFHVDSRVLIPRPETELLVETAIGILRARRPYFSHTGRPPLIADIGTGCGAIAISLALNVPGVKIYATDISPEALQVARLNCRHHNLCAQISFLAGDLLEPVPEPVDMIVANLPYIESADLLCLDAEIVGYEPALALDGGPTGLHHIRGLLEQSRSKILPQGHILFETGHRQATAAASLVNHYLPQASLQFLVDPGGIHRVAKVDLQGTSLI